MKKIVIVVASVIVLLALILILVLRSSSGYRSIYFVPDDAVLILEAKDPLLAWDKIIHSSAWNHYSKNEFFSELNEDILSYDSLVNSSKFLLKLVGKKSVTFSQHHLGNNKYEYIYVVDIGKVADYKNIQKVLKPILGKDYEITTRSYKEAKIIELYDLVESAHYFMAFTQGKLIFSFEPKLVEAAIDASEDKIIGRDTKYLHVQSKVGNQGLFSIYFSYQNMSRLLSSLSPEASKSFVNGTKYFGYTGVSFDIDEQGLMQLEGYTSFADSTPDSYFTVIGEGTNEVVSAKVIPRRLASMVKINFEDAAGYFQSFMKSMGDKDYTEYTQNLKKIEKKLKISLDKNLFSWMENEIVLLQTQPSNLGRSNEFAAILHASDSAEAAINLNLLWRQIKKNTPVKIKSVDYKGYKIDYIAFPGIIKALFGNALKKLEKPYFTQIGDNVIISNHPQTLKNIIDDFMNGETIQGSKEYLNFNSLFDEDCSANMYFEPPVLFTNLKALVDAGTWKKLQANKKFITCLSQAGLSINKTGNLMHFQFLAQYKADLEEWKMQHYNSSEITSLFNNTVPVEINEEDDMADSLPNILISDLDANEYKDFFEDGSLKLEVDIKNGLKHGTIKEYHPNGKLKLKGQYEDDEPVGKWKYYDEDGEHLKTDRY